MKHRSKAFSLIELLVAIGIIALLIGILMPALTAAREHAYRVQCLSNIRQLTMAWVMYANEHSGHFCSSNTQSVTAPATYPLAGIDPTSPYFWSWIGLDNPGQQNIPRGLLWPYLRDQQVYFCPHDPFPGNTIYAINGMLAGSIGVPKTLLSLSEVKHTAQTFAFIEQISGDPSHRSRHFTRTAFRSPLYPETSFFQPPGDYHPLGGSNGATISFVDGHAIFWQYASPDVGINVDLDRHNPDLIQLEAWSGGPVPPNSVQ